MYQLCNPMSMLKVVDKIAVAQADADTNQYVCIPLHVCNPVVGNLAKDNWAFPESLLEPPGDIWNTLELARQPF